MIPKICDLSHNNADVQFGELYDAGVLAVIFKRSQGVGFKDDTFESRVARARSVGLRVGAYHFADASDASAQLENFKAGLSGQGALLQCLDFESNPAGGDATAPIAASFINGIVADFGRHPLTYGSDFLPKLASAGYDSVAAACPLWQARYASQQPTPPAPWTEWALWQFSENGGIVLGGVNRTDIDLSVYNSTMFPSDDAFLAWWDARAVTVP